MALINIPTDHIIKLRKTLPIEKKPLMLKDYLRDDLGSCSSRGFKSFPRRQCCTTVRFLLEADLKKSKVNYSTATKRLLKRSRSKPGSAAISALQRASDAVLNVVKLLPFSSIKSSSSSPSPSYLKNNGLRKGHLPRSFSRKLFKRSLWRKADKEDDGGGGEIKRWKLFREFFQEKNQQSDQNTADNSTTVITGRSSNSWAEREFTADILQSSRGNSESSIQDDAVLSKRNVPENKNVSNMVGVIAGEDSINSIKEEGNEQSSPVSILEFPFDDDEEEENGSAFEDHLAQVEGTKQKLMQKIRRFERLAQLEPMDLEKRIAMAELEDESLESDKSVVVDMGTEEFGVKILKNEMNPLEPGQELEVNEGIKAYVKEMEKNGNWIKFNEEKEDIGSAVELELFGSLVDQLLIDLFSHSLD